MGKKNQVWFETDLGYETTKEELFKHAEQRGKASKIMGLDNYYGRFTFRTTAFRDATVQITTRSKLSISYPEEMDYKIILNEVKPFLRRADGSPVKKIREMTFEKMKITREEPALQVRSDHTRDLKEEVIKPWLRQLPEVDIDGAHFPKSSTPFIGDSTLSVESAFLFDHFREHVCYKPDPFQLLESFKKKSGEFRERRLDLEGRISRYGDLAEKMLEASAGKVPATVRDFAKWCRDYPSGSKLEKVEYLKELEKIGKKPFSTDARKLLAMFDELESLREKMRVVLEKHLHRAAPFPVECDLIRSGTL